MSGFYVTTLGSEGTGGIQSKIRKRLSSAWTFSSEYYKISLPS
jgi:hypothetical protein